MIVSNKSSQVFRFLSSTAFGVSLYYLILYGLTEMGVWYIVSAVAGRTVNFSLNFALHRHWTFGKNNEKNMGRQMMAYVLSVAATFGANLLILYILVEYAGLWYMAAQAAASIILTVIGFFVSRKIFLN